MSDDWREQVTTRDAIREEFYKVVREENAALQQKLDAIRELCRSARVYGKLSQPARALAAHVLAILDREAP